MEGSVSGEGPEGAAPKPRGSSTPQATLSGATGQILAKALSSRKAPKAQAGKAAGRRPKPSEGDGGAQAAREAQPGSPTTRSLSPEGAREPPLPSATQPLPAESPGEEAAPKKATPTPEATFTPTTAGLRPRETQEAGISPGMRLLISEAIAEGIARGIQKKGQAASPAPHHTLRLGQPPAPGTPRDSPVLPRPPSSAASMRGPGSLLDDEEQNELMLSDDEGVTPDPPAFSGALFRSASFKSLLYEAKTTAQIGGDPAATDPASGFSDPNKLVFSEPKTDNEEIPCPKLFLDVIQQQWPRLDTYAPLSGNDKRFYNVAPNLTAALKTPTIDMPVAALVSSTILFSDMMHALKPEDKKAELTLRKAHMAAAWAIKSATAASFFNRTSLLWLKEIQARIPDTDLRTHQDINKLIAATEFSADATLNSAKFASRAIASTVTARRLLWLRYWQADMKYKWKLASAPFKGDKLFGEALEPILIETKDKKKVLPSMPRRNDQRSTPYYRKPSFRAADTAQDFSQPQGAYFQPHDRQSDRPGYRGKSRQQFQSKRPFQGNGNRSFRGFNR